MNSRLTLWWRCIGNIGVLAGIIDSAVTIERAMADAGEEHQVAPPLIVGVSTRALFQLEEEHMVFESEGVVAYARLQRAREDVWLNMGAVFEVVRRLLALNEGRTAPLVDVILLSRNSPDLSFRAFKSAEEYGLKIERGSFTSARSVAPFVSASAISGRPMSALRRQRG